MPESACDCDRVGQQGVARRVPAFVTRDCDVCFACFCPAGYYAIWVPAMWQSAGELVAFHVQEIWNDGETTLSAESASGLPPFVVPLIPKGGPWTGRYVSDALQVAFVPGTSPSDAGAFAIRFTLRANVGEQPTPNQSVFNTAPGEDAAPKLEEVGASDLSPAPRSARLPSSLAFAGQRSTALTGRREALLASITQTRSLFDDLRFSVEVGPIVDGEAAAGRWVAEGAYRGSVPGSTVSTGTRVRFHGNDIWRAEGGLIREYWLSDDLLDLMQQLGVLPAG